MIKQQWSREKMLKILSKCSPLAQDKFFRELQFKDINIHSLDVVQDTFLLRIEREIDFDQHEGRSIMRYYEIFFPKIYSKMTENAYVALSAAPQESKVTVRIIGNELVVEDTAKNSIRAYIKHCRIFSSDDSGGVERSIQMQFYTSNCRLVAEKLIDLQIDPEECYFCGVANYQPQGSSKSSSFYLSTVNVPDDTIEKLRLSLIASGIPENDLRVIQGKFTGWTARDYNSE